MDESMNGEIAITVIATGFPVGTTTLSSPGTECIYRQRGRYLIMLLLYTVRWVAQLSVE